MDSIDTNYSLADKREENIKSLVYRIIDNSFDMNWRGKIHRGENITFVNFFIEYKCSI